MMAHIEMDPLLRRGIRLMLSKSPDALEQLKALAEEALIAKQRSTSGKLDLRRESPVARSRHTSPSPNTLVVSSKDLKREHHMQDDSSLSIHPSKRSRQADNTTHSHTPSPTPSSKSDGSSSRGGTRRSDESEQEADINDIAMEIASEISCIVCKRISFFSLNQLVECQECHSIYHQECHKPPVSKADITDPRRVWYCAKCIRNMRKQTSSGSSSVSGSSGGVSSSTRSSNSNLKSSSSSSSSRHAQQSPSKSSSSHNPSPSKSSSIGSGSSSVRSSPFTNLASVTTRANIGSDRSGGGSSSVNSSSCRDNKSNSSSSNSGSASGRSGDSKGSGNVPTTAPSNSLLSAERRMQMMKKKAAAKMAERRKM
uniref:Integrator complex subunit 12 n=1 Tax=Hirondellea gigas TaxID=1518452 RepID=A0A2P2IAX0_9CRUS